MKQPSSKPIKSIARSGTTSLTESTTIKTSKREGFTTARIIPKTELHSGGGEANLDIKSSVMNDGASVEGSWGKLGTSASMSWALRVWFQNGVESLAAWGLVMALAGLRAFWTGKTCLALSVQLRNRILNLLHRKVLR